MFHFCVSVASSSGGGEGVITRGHLWSVLEVLDLYSLHVCLHSGSSGHILCLILSVIIITCIPALADDLFQV